MKYKLKDFENVASGKSAIEDMCEYYGVSRKLFIQAMNRKGYYLKKTTLRIISPNKTKIVHSFSACADELGVSEQTIKNAIKGKRVKLFEELGIKVEIVE